MKRLFQTMILALGRVMPGVIFLCLSRQAEANPTGMTVQSGNATLSINGSQLTVTAGNNAFLNWQHFNIAAGEQTIFNQPSAASIVWNRINDQNPSQIYGSLQANGVVVLLNSSGFYFGPNSFVSAAGLVVSTANCAPPQNGGSSWEFNGPPPLASIINYGQMQIGKNGSCFLIADQVENHGSIEAPGGSVGLAAGQTVTLSERPDGRGMSMQVTLPQGSVNNYGAVVADAGIISLNAKVVNQNGFIQANSVKDVNGVIELVAGDQLNLGGNSQIVAAGDDSAAGSAGGSITLKSDNTFGDAAGSQISVAGGANGGNGGSVEISAPAMSAVHSTIDGSAQAGSTDGTLLLDPKNIVLNNSGSGADPNTLYYNPNSAFHNLSAITLAADQDITLASGTRWNLSTGSAELTGTLVLEAGRNIIFGNSSSITDTKSWSLEMYAGVADFALKTVTPGAGSIFLNGFDPSNPGSGSVNGNGSIQLAAGNITMVAGQDIIVGLGHVITTGGGSITAHALAGNIDTGGDPFGYKFSGGSSMDNAYSVDSSLGGISTVAGGDVTLIAGGNITSLLPIEGNYVYDGVPVPANGSIDSITAGAGAYGKQPGNVTIVAGGDVTGHYVVANGTGNIFAGVQMDGGGNPVTDAGGNYALGATGDAGNSLAQPNLSLSLISGGWNVTAAHNINLQEVNNPNGDFNINSGSVNHQFNYAPTAYVNLTAGNLVQLGASSALLPRLDSKDSLQVPLILPGTLNITAGAGGVVLTGDSTYSQLILFPSPQGSLTINTSHGGSLVAGYFSDDSSTAPTVDPSFIFNLIVSDSGNKQYSAGLFGLGDHAATPVHLNSEMPLKLKIDGSMQDIFLVAPEAAQVAVGHDMTDCFFQGMNLSSDDVTSIQVGGAISYDLSSGYGLQIGGGGKFDVTAGSIDLGSTVGIQSLGVGLYLVDNEYPLASQFNVGADLQVKATGDIKMFNTSIASLNGGNIFVDAGGSIEVGAPGGAATALGARGIYSTGQGNVTVIANGDIDVAGSRIAAYDGGSVTVESKNGNINAGSGGSGFVVVSSFKVDPRTQAVAAETYTIPGSGILATTFPNAPGQVVGNILVETPNGNINASSGGIVQLPLNGVNTADSIVEILAGYELRDSSGNPVYAAHIGSGTPVQVGTGKDIDASGSGVIGSTVELKATGDINGAVFARNNINIDAQQNVSVTALAEGSINVNSGGSISGTLIGVGGISASGSSDTANLESNQGVSGDTSGSKGLAQGSAANSASQSASATDQSAASAAAKTDSSADDDALKKKKPITLARKISRVTVILPGKNN